MEDTNSVGTGDTMETIEEELKVGIGLEEGFDEIEIEDFFEHVDVIGYGVNDFNGEISVGFGANLGEVDLISLVWRGDTSGISASLYSLMVLVI